MENKKKDAAQKSIQQMAEEVDREGVGLSGSELSDLVASVMRNGGYDPKNTEIRKKIGECWQEIRRAS